MGVLDSVTSAASSAADKVQTAASAAAESAKELAEKTTLTGIGIPEPWVLEYQKLRRELGISAPDATGLFFWGIVIMILFGILASLAYRLVLGGLMFLYNGFTFKLKKPFHIFLFLAIILGILGFLFFVLVSLQVAEDEDSATAKASITAATKPASGFQNRSDSSVVDIPELTLANIQPLTVKQAGYIGPREENGMFDEETGIISALRAGARMFTLQIDYLEKEKDPKQFDAPHIPTLLYRNDSGDLISRNGLSLKAVAKRLEAFAFNSEIGAFDQPLILYLHFVRTPNSLRTPEKYVKFMAKVAEDLAPLAKFSVSIQGDGNFQRQASEKILLNTPMKQFQGKVLYFTNADTSLFRNLAPLGLKEFAPENDLDYLVNMRFYSEDATTALGVTEPAPAGRIPTGVLIPFSSLKSLSAKEKDVFASKGKTRFVIAMPSQAQNPAIEEIEDAIDTLGVNSIPLNFFDTSMEVAREKIRLWKEPFYRMKKPVLMSYNPETTGASMANKRPLS